MPKQQADLMFEDQTQRLGVVELDDQDVDDVDMAQQIGQDAVFRALDIGLDQHVALARNAGEDRVDGRIVRLLAAIEHALSEVDRAAAKEPAVVAPDADAGGHARDRAPAAEDVPDAFGDVLDEAPGPDRVVVAVDVDAGADRLKLLLEVPVDGDAEGEHGVDVRKRASRQYVAAVKSAADSHEVGKHVGLEVVQRRRQQHGKGSCFDQGWECGRGLGQPRRRGPLRRRGSG